MCVCVSSCECVCVCVCVCIYICIYTYIGDIECESQVILIEHDVCVREFAPAVYRCLPKVGPNGN